MICGLIRSPIARSVRDVVKSAGCVGISATVGAGRAPGVGSYRGHGSVVSRGWRGRAQLGLEPALLALVERVKLRGLDIDAHVELSHEPAGPGRRLVPALETG